MVGDRALDKRRGCARLGGQERGQLGPADHARVVLEGHQAAPGVGGEGVGDHLEQGFFVRFAVDHLAAAEKAVARVLGVGVVQVHDLDDGRIAAAAGDEVVVVQLPVPLVHARAGDVQQAVRALGQQVHLVDRLGLEAGLEGGERCRVGALGHAVVVAGDEPVQVLAFGHQVAARAFHPGDAVQAHGPTDGHQVGRPGGGEVEPGPDLDHPLAAQLRLEGDRVQEKAVGQDEPQPFHLRGGHRAGVGDVEAVGEVGADPPVKLGDECGHDGFLGGRDGATGTGRPGDRCAVAGCKPSMMIVFFPPQKGRVAVFPAARRPLGCAHREGGEDDGSHAPAWEPVS